MSKWKVEKIPNYFFSPDRLEWVAWLEGNWAECRGFRTHAEALAYADEEARTREVVLPRVDDRTSIDENDLDIMICRLDNLICIDQPSFGKPGENELIVISSEFAEEVALALLAHAERMSE